MSRDPAVLFYTSDFLAGTMTMSNEHVGMYIRLLCLQHQKGMLSEKDMCYICTTYVDDVYKKFIKTSDGLYFNKRMQDEINKRIAYSESRRNNIKKRYTRKRATYVLHMGNENEDENINKNGNENVSCSSHVLGGAGGEKYDQEFLVFWKMYPKKVGKAAAQRSWRIHVKKKTVPLSDLLKALAWQRQSDQWTKNNGQYIPNPETWLNQGRWNDEPQEILTPAYKPPVFLGA